MAGRFEIPDQVRFNTPDSDKLYDAMIIGAGPAGMTATVYCARKKLDILLITKDIGGQILRTDSIENYMGYQYIKGSELSDKFVEQISKFPIAILQDTEICGFSVLENGFGVRCGENSFMAKSAIIATGKRTRELGVPGEKEYLGKGVAYCSVCDAPLFHGKTVAVAGGGNSALTAAIDLLPYAVKIFLINTADEIQGDPVLLEKINNSGKVEIIVSSGITEIKGAKTVQSVTIENNITKQKKEIALGGVFVEIGMVPNSDFVKDILLLNVKDEIIIDCNSKTSVKGVFACGDVTSVMDKQIIIACGEGAKAALAAYRYILSKK